jgi:hypothetical protein
MNNTNINVDLSSAIDVACEKCAGLVFREAALIKKVSALLSPSGKEMYIPISTFACAACGHINNDFDPTKKLPIK